MMHVFHKDEEQTIIIIGVGSNARIVQRKHNSSAVNVVRDHGLLLLTFQIRMTSVDKMSRYRTASVDVGVAVIGDDEEFVQLENALSEFRGGTGFYHGIGQNIREAP